VVAGLVRFGERKKKELVLIDDLPDQSVWAS
jgi:hypothetical protein